VTGTRNKPGRRLRPASTPFGADATEGVDAGLPGRRRGHASPGMTKQQRPPAYRATLTYMRSSPHRRQIRSLRCGRSHRVMAGLGPATHDHACFSTASRGWPDCAGHDTGVIGAAMLMPMGLMPMGPSPGTTLGEQCHLSEPRRVGGIGGRVVRDQPPTGVFRGAA
jgi:hypothetical protein